jgi:two-component system sensor kinase FixL
MTLMTRIFAVDGWIALVLAVRRPLAAYGAAILGAAGGLMLRLALAPLFEERAAFLFFVPAVVCAAALGGVWPGVLATVLAAAGGLLVTWLAGTQTAADQVM